MYRLVALGLVCAMGCARSGYDRAWVQRAVVQHTGHRLRDTGPAPQDGASLPPGVEVSRGLTARDAVAIALWNNPAFQAELTQLGFARADLAEAGLLPNPTLALLLPLGPRQLEAWLAWPVEVLWHRPRRVEAAQRDVERVARGLVQTGLDLARDARLAHAELVLAQRRWRLRREGADTLEALAALVEARWRAGDVGAPEAAAARFEAGMAREAALRAEGETEAARARLHQVMGVAELGRAVEASPVADGEPVLPALDRLVTVALAARPDVRAAELAMEAAGARRGWERARVIGAVARLDAFGPAPEGTGPSQASGRVGVQVTVPLFNQNQAGRARAEAEWERAVWRYAQLRQQIVQDVTVARAQVVQARGGLSVWRATVMPAADAALAAATEALARGEASRQPVLEATRRRLDAQLREAELEAELSRALAQLARSTGGHDAGG